MAISSFRNLRVLGWIEAISYLLLLLVAMPLKYLADMPLAVRIVGAAHGGLFIAFVALVAWYAWRGRLDPRATAFCLLGSVLPFGPLLYERELRRLEARETKP
jgi:integral membrane protein